jgi:hypothetical protein
MFGNRLSTEQIVRCHAESRNAIGRRLASVFQTDLSANLPDRLERSLDKLREADLRAAGTEMNNQRYQQHNYGVDWIDISLLLTVAGLAAVLAVAAAWIGLR